MNVADTAFEVGICHVFNALVWMVFTRFVYLQAYVDGMIRKLVIAAVMLLSYITVARHRQEHGRENWMSWVQS